MECAHGRPTFHIYIYIDIYVYTNMKQNVQVIEVWYDCAGAGACVCGCAWVGVGGFTYASRVRRAETSVAAAQEELISRSRAAARAT